jgi:hypothetical protein
MENILRLDFVAHWEEQQSFRKSNEMFSDVIGVPRPIERHVG